MAKDPSPKADGLQAMREARYGHLQAKAESDKAERLEALRKAVEQKMRPYAGKNSKGIAPPAGPRTEAQKARTAAKKARQRAKHKRRTELPPEGETK